MTDVCVTVPKGLWTEWLEEGDLAGEPWSEKFESHFWVANLPRIAAGERVYIVAHGKLRGYAPLVTVEARCRMRRERACLLRRNDAVAVTIDESIRGFQGWRYRWWDPADERPFPGWKTP